MKGLPSLSASSLPTARARKSTAEPAGKGTIRVTGRSGQAPSAAASGQGAKARTRPSRAKENRRMFPPVYAAFSAACIFLAPSSRHGFFKDRQGQQVTGLPRRRDFSAQRFDNVARLLD